MATPVADVPTPALLIDLDRVEANLRRGQAYADAQGVDLRPHAKTHKSPRFAHAQVAAGAVGVCVAKLGEAEVMADAGIADLFMPNTVVGPDKAARAVALAQRGRFAIGVDHPAQVEGLARAADAVVAAGGRPLEVLVEVDLGSGRGGAPAEEVPDLLRRVRDAPGLRARGVYAYEGFVASELDRGALVARHDEAQRALLAVAEAANPWIDGPRVVSMGSTPSLLADVPLRPGITEVRPGTYVFDHLQEAPWAGGQRHSAAHVLASVVSVRAAADGHPARAILDAGSKALTSDRRAGQVGHGLLVDHGLTVVRLSEEHGVVEGAGVERLRVGDKVRVLMNHVCPVVNLFAEMHLTRGDEVVEVLPVAARGRLV
jgi:D-serine deaminase-like pyridoxal phosphate-dependent protein